MPSRPQSPREERVNAFTHGAGVLVGASVLTAMVMQTVGTGWLPLTAVLVYGLCFTALFGASAAYHAVSHPGWKKRLQKLDHCAIHLLIAGTYTPVALLVLDGWVGTAMLATVWGLAALGIALELFLVPRKERLSVALYLGSGWVALFAAVPLVRALPGVSLALIVAGGLLYTVGVPFYMRNRAWDHAIWHGFVLGGAGTHGLAVLSFL